MPMPKRQFSYREIRSRARVRKLLRDEMRYQSLSYIARQCRLNKSTLHRFLYDAKAIKEQTTIKILFTLLRISEHRKSKRLPLRSLAMVSRKGTLDDTATDELA